MAFIAKHPDAVHPVTRAIVSGGRDPLAVDAFKAFYRLAAFRQAAQQAFAGIDTLVVPTAPAAYNPGSQVEGFEWTLCLW